MSRDEADCLGTKQIVLGRNKLYVIDRSVPVHKWTHSAYSNAQSCPDTNTICLQVFLTNGRLQMYRNKEVVHSGEAGDGVCFVINGIVKVTCVDLKDTQDYFLGSGEACHLSVCLSICWYVCLADRPCK